MYIIPAIDIKNGNCVRLTKGEKNSEIIFSYNPAEVARKWESCGAQWIHVVDLDGAFGGKPVNIEVVEKIVGSVECSVQVGGGIRNVETVDRYFDAGVERIIIGTAAFDNTDFLKIICEKYPGRIAVGIDTKDGRIAVNGWRETIDKRYADVVSELSEVGVSLIVHTNVDRDGTLEGVNIAPVSDFINSSEIPVIVSGGISTLQDLESISGLENGNLYGVILGKSIYMGNIDLKTAVQRYS